MSHGRVKELNDGELFGELSAAGPSLVVVDFTATWCGPCRAIAPLFIELSNQYPHVVFLKVDVDKCRSTAQSCSVSAMPTFHFYIKSKMVAEFRGADPNKLKQYIQTYQVTAPASFSTPGQALGHGSGQSSLLKLQQQLDEQAKTSNNNNNNNNNNTTTTQAAPANTKITPDTTMIKELLEMGFPENRAKKALIIVKNSSSQAAMDWIFENMDKPDIDDPLPEETTSKSTNTTTPSSTTTSSTTSSTTNNNNNDTTTSTSTETPTVHNAICDLCQKQIIGLRFKCKVCPNFDMCQDCKFSGKHPEEHECDVHEKDIENYQMTPEERAQQRAKLEARIQEVRKKKSEDEAKREIEREISRRSSGKQQQDSLKKWQEDQLRREQEKIKKEKEDEFRAKQKIKERIEQDRLERLAKKNASAGTTAPTPAAAPVAAAVPTPTKSLDSYTEVTIQIRLSTGENIRGQFKPQDTISVVHKYVSENGQKGSFKLGTTYPRKIFDSNEMKTVTLLDAGLVPNGTLMVSTQ